MSELSDDEMRTMLRDAEAWRASRATVREVVMSVPWVVMVRVRPLAPTRVGWVIWAAGCGPRPPDAHQISDAADRVRWNTRATAECEVRPAVLVTVDHPGSRATGASLRIAAFRVDVAALSLRAAVAVAGLRRQAKPGTYLVDAETGDVVQ